MWQSFYLIALISISQTHSWKLNPNREFGDTGNKFYEDIDPGEPLILSPFIEAGDYQKARYLSRAYHEDFPNTESYSGFLTVNKKHNSNLFFWFFPAEEHYEAAPVVLWLQGGPGGSSLFGLFIENGPFEMKNQDEIHFRKYSWTKKHSVLYIDNPAGTGFSFTDKDGYCTGEEQIGEEIYIFLIQFFLLFPEINENDFIISGESYAGKYVPAIAYTIMKRNPTAGLKINLKGLAIGDGVTDPVHQHEYADYLYQLGLVDVNTKLHMKTLEKELIFLIENEQWLLATAQGEKILHMFTEKSGISNMYNYLDQRDPTLPGKKYSSQYLQRNDVRAAIHVGRLPYDSGQVFDALRTDIMKSVAPWVSELLSSYRLLLYTGQVDVIAAYPLTINYLQHLNFSGADLYKVAPRNQWYVGNDLAGYVKVAGNLTEVLVRDAGHMAPFDQPKWCQDLIYKFSRNIPLS